MDFPTLNNWWSQFSSEGLLKGYWVSFLFFNKISMANNEDPDPRMQCQILVCIVFVSYKKD